MPGQIEVTGTVPASPDQIYVAWMSSVGHAAMTGGAAEVDARVGGTYTAWDGYITGINLELEPGRRIVQAWRSSEFPDDSPDSRLEIVLEAADGSTRVTIRHTEIPDGQESAYASGWREHYLVPMAAYFQAGAKLAAPKKPAAKQAAAKKPAAKKSARKKPAKNQAAAKKAAGAKAGTKKAPAKPARKAASRKVKSKRRARR